MTNYIDKQQEFTTLCKRLQSELYIGVDTEFVGERYYYPKLALIQLATINDIWLIDPLTIEDLSPLHDVLSNPETVVVMHDAEIDSQILYRACEVRIPNLFDTQLAAAFVGMTESIGLSTLVRKVTGERLSKGQQVTNWLKRPLTKKQKIYAAHDVEYLHDLYKYLQKRLRNMKRIEAYYEEIESKRKSWHSPVDIEHRFRKMLGASGMTKRRYTTLNLLLTWREKVAIKRNIPRRHVLSDEALITISQQPPREIGDLKNQRLVSDKFIKKYGDKVIRILEEVHNIPKDRLKRPEPFKNNGSRVSSKVPLVKMAMEALAAEVGIAPGLIARKDDIKHICQAVVASKDYRNHPDIPALNGWRGKLVGKRLWSFACGEASLRIGSSPKEPAVIIK